MNRKTEEFLIESYNALTAKGFNGSSKREPIDELPKSITKDPAYYLRTNFQNMILYAGVDVKEAKKHAVKLGLVVVPNATFKTGFCLRTKAECTVKQKLMSRLV